MNFTFWITEDCNLRCKYCYVKKNSQYMDLQTAEAAVTFLKATVVGENAEKIRVNFHGGETTLNFKVIRFVCDELEKISIERHIPVYFSLTTNGINLKEDVIDYLIERKISVSVSVDGDKETHDKNRVFLNGDGSFDKVMKGLFKLQKRKVHVRVRMTVTSDTVSRLSENFVQIYKLGFKGVVAIPDVSITSWDELSASIYEQEINKIADFFKSQSKDEYYYHILNKQRCFFMELGTCDGGRNSFQIDPSGNLYPCLSVVGEREFIIGDVVNGINNIQLQTYDPIIDSKNKVCQGCILTDRCTGEQCKYVNYSITGNYNQPSASFCKFRQMEYRLLKKHFEVINS